MLDLRRVEYDNGRGTVSSFTVSAGNTKEISTNDLFVYVTFEVGRMTIIPMHRVYSMEAKNLG